MQMISYVGRYDEMMTSYINHLLRRHINGFDGEYTSLKDSDVHALYKTNFEYETESAVIQEGTLLTRWYGLGGTCFFRLNVSQGGNCRGTCSWESESSKTDSTQNDLEACVYIIDKGYVIVGIEHRSNPDCFVLALHQPTVIED